MQAAALPEKPAAVQLHLALIPLQEAEASRAASEAALRACEQQRERLVEAVARAADQRQQHPDLEELQIQVTITD